MNIEKYLMSELKKSISNNTMMVDNLIKICNSFYEKPVHNLQEMKQRNQKVKGDIFECFCKQYLIHCYGMITVWLLSEVPDDVLLKLNLKRKDYGIDLIGIDKNGKYHAIQAKFRKRRNKL